MNEWSFTAACAVGLLGCGSWLTIEGHWIAGPILLSFGVLSTMTITRRS